MNSNNPNKVYYEMTGIEHFLKDYETKQICMCRVVNHPIFGIDCYPATIFTNADPDLIKQFID